MKYIVSISFGKDSLAMLLKLLEKKVHIDEVIFFDTGMEFNSIYANRDKVSGILHELNITYTELKPKNHFLFDMMVRPVQYRNPKTDEKFHYGYSWCGGNSRWGTSMKTQAINNYYKIQYPNEKIIEYVGIAADEMNRIKDDPRKRYPLIDFGMTEKDCLEYCYRQGFDWNENGVELYSVLDRVSCWCCRNKNLKELKNIYMYLPEYWQRLRGLQSRISDPMKGSGKSVFDLEKRFDAEIRSDVT